MKTQTYQNTKKIWLSAKETYNWAHKPGAIWPCSQLSGHRVFAEFHSSDLIDVAIDGKSNVYCDANEFNAIMHDHGIDC